MDLTIKTVTSSLIEDVARLFETDKVTDRCWCMWFIIPVKDFHAAGREGNHASFCQLTADCELPVGLVAYQSGEPVGWCAVGPRSRYARALSTPTYRGGEAGEETIGGDIWLVPCFFVRRDARGAGVSRALLGAAIRLAGEHNAAAIEGFPFSGTKRRSSGDLQVGTQSLFSSCGFEIIRTPSASRVVMRRLLKP